MGWVYRASERMEDGMTLFFIALGYLTVLNLLQTFFLIWVISYYADESRFQRLVQGSNSE
jgi:hypothetical protein